MALCPFAEKKLIPPGENDPRIEPRLAVLHVDGGNAESLFGWFDGPSGGVESHFFVKRDGTLEQYRDTAWEADANLRANPFAVSIETQGFGRGEWTPEQLATIKRLLVWLHRTHGIPLRKVRHWDGSGVGYHVMFGAPGPWTPSAKTCPGPDRIAQFDSVLVPWFPVALVPNPSPTPNITAALEAGTRAERVAALERVVQLGSDDAQQAALAWLAAIAAIQRAEAKARAARSDIKEEEVR